MKTKNINLNDLIILSKEKGYYIGDKNIGYELQLKEIINLLEISPGFKKYLEKKGFNDYAWTYFIFGLIINYIELCYKSGKFDEIGVIINYLDKLSISNNKSIINLLIIGALEQFCNNKQILPYIIEIMPNNLKKIFIDNFPNI